MKIVEDSQTRLVLKQSALNNQILGVIFIVAGLVVGVFAISKSPLVALVGGVFAVVGVWAFVSAKSDTVVADKSSRQLTVSFKSIIKHGQDQSYAFDQVLSVLVPQNISQQYVQDATPGTRSGISFGPGVGHTVTTVERSLVVQLKDGTTLTVGDERRQANLILGASKSSVVAAGEKLAAAVGVPLQTPGGAGMAAAAPPAMPGSFVQADPAQAATAQPTPPPAPAPAEPSPPAAAEPGTPAGPPTPPAS